MSETPDKPCVRGCMAARRHLAMCEDEDCFGCQPRPAKHGLLCYPCHSRLRNLVRSIHVQWALLLATAGKSCEQVLTAETTAKTHQPPRTDSDGRFPAPYAKGRPAASESEPVRIAAVDAARELADWLSCALEVLIEAHDLTGPPRLSLLDPDPRAWKWHPVTETGAASDFDPIVTYRDEREVMRGQYLLTDPPTRFEVRQGADYLLAWLDRFEALEQVGDECEALGELMSRCHALAPWREDVARVRGIPCPSCHATTLVRFGGDEDITCLRCRDSIAPGRYLIWTRMLADEHRERA